MKKEQKIRVSYKQKKTIHECIYFYLIVIFLIQFLLSYFFDLAIWVTMVTSQLGHTGIYILCNYSSCFTISFPDVANLDLSKKNFSLWVKWVHDCPSWLTHLVCHSKGIKITLSAATNSAEHRTEYIFAWRRSQLRREWFCWPEYPEVRSDVSG